MQLKEFLEALQDYGYDLSDVDSISEDDQLLLADVGYRSNKEVSIQEMMLNEHREEDGTPGKKDGIVYLLIGYETDDRYLQGSVREEWGQ